MLSWQLMDKEGVSHTFTPRSSLNMDDLQAICDAALAGHGIAWLPCWMASKEIHQGKLVPPFKAGAGCARFDGSCGLATDAASTAEGENCRRYARQPFTVRDVAGYACAHKKAALNARPE
ncbi:transcriptional regulator [Klebsiella oxytoca]|nr:transcriptional regulator [Klebsiella oxytoca]